MLSLKVTVQSNFYIGGKNEKTYFNNFFMHNIFVSSPIKKSDLKRLKKRFTFLRNQLYKNNDNYERLNEIIVKTYSEKIEEYLMFVEDLSD